jgi:hypothetical protein
MARHHMLRIEGENASPPCDALAVASLPPPCGRATPAADCAERGPQAFYSAADFVATWIAPPVRVPVARDFTFKAVAGEPSW